MQNSDSPTYRQTLVLLNLLIVGVVVGCAILIFLTVKGYGTARLNDIPNGATVRINGHTTNSTLLKMRPGNYQIVVWTPLTKPYQTTLTVHLFQTTIFSPKLQDREPQAIVSAAIGAVGENGAPHIGRIKWFEDKTWLVGAVTPGGTIAMHYDTATGQWSVAYYTGGGYPEDLSQLPSDIASYITTIGKQDV